MENLNEKTVSKISKNENDPIGIRRERLKYLKGKYQKPSLEIFIVDIRNFKENYNMACTIDCYDSKCQCVSF
jgi:hypothetical protein